MVRFPDWLHTGFRLVLDWHEEFQILSSYFRLLQNAFIFISDCSDNRKNFRFCLHVSDCFILAGASTDEENAAAITAAEEEDPRQTDLEWNMEDAAANLERLTEAVA